MKLQSCSGQHRWGISRVFSGDDSLPDGDGQTDDGPAHDAGRPEVLVQGAHGRGGHVGEVDDGPPKGDLECVQDEAGLAAVEALHPAVMLRQKLVAYNERGLASLQAWPTWISIPCQKRRSSNARSSGLGGYFTHHAESNGVGSGHGHIRPYHTSHGQPYGPHDQQQLEDVRIGLVLGVKNAHFVDVGGIVALEKVCVKIGRDRLRAEVGKAR